MPEKKVFGCYFCHFFNVDFCDVQGAVAHTYVGKLILDNAG